MKTISSAFLSMIQTNEFLVQANLYQFTLPSGSVFYWTDAQQNIIYNGNTYLAANLDSQPGFQRGQLKTSIGLNADSLDIDVLYDTNTRINNMTPAAFALAGGFDNALVTVSKLLSVPGSAVSQPLLDQSGADLYDQSGIALLDQGAAGGWISVAAGTVNLFTGIVAEVQADSGVVKLTVNSLLRLLNTAFPRNYFLPQCNHALFDAGCTLLASNFAVAGTVAGVSNTLTYFGSGLTNAAGYFALGYVVWLTGANAGLRSFVKSYDGAGNFTLPYPLDSIPAVGDTFTAYPGCDKLQATCTAKFNNLANFRGFPYVPTPETLELGPGASPQRIGGLGGAGGSHLGVGPGGTNIKFASQ